MAAFSLTYPAWLSANMIPLADMNRASVEEFLADPYKQTVYSALLKASEEGQVADAAPQARKAYLTLTSLFLTGPLMVGELPVWAPVKVERAKAAEKDPHADSWIDAVTAALCAEFEKVAIAQVPALVRRAMAERTDGNYLPNSGVPVIIARDASDETLLQAFFTCHVSHTRLLNGKMKVLAVTPDGTIRQKNKDGAAAKCGVAFGFRTDACRSEKKEKEAAPAAADASVPASALASLPG